MPPHSHLSIFLTVVAGQAPASGHTLHATFKVVPGCSQAHRGHAHSNGGWAGQLDQQDVVVDGETIVAGVLENLREKESKDNLLHP